MSSRHDTSLFATSRAYQGVTRLHFAPPMEVRNFALLTIASATQSWGFVNYGGENDSGINTEQQHLTLTTALIAKKVENAFENVLKNIRDDEDEESSKFGEGRRRKKKKSEIMFLTKTLMALKVALLGVVLPLGVIASKVLSWKAVTLSLLAFMLAKIVFFKNLLMPLMASSTSAPSAAPPVVPPAPIVIHSSSPSHDHVWKRTAEPKIHLQPEVHVHQASEDKRPTWGWSEGRSEPSEISDGQDLVYRGWNRKT